ncbi:MAG TPA: D-alanine--D-alanine ligase [Candidatus Paceibacterota bacterium]|nr:D-alanine--D-alanine ligase [Candidatus Paceibacterota bacterium]HMP18781.1 D-alanine--D-alanine ligase [Candidatus Paceibacterota bacterium]HMP85505.1 D-alanine--D-alanine ligase [Candidatus Paceibacterota bacterium]
MKKKIVVIRGGPSNEHEVSMKTGRSVIDELSKENDVLDVVVDRSGIWVSGGSETSPEKVCANSDCVFNAMHGEYGEDGKVQRILENVGVPFTGPQKASAAISMNKKLTKDIYQKFGIKTPIYKVVKKTDGDVHTIAIDIFRSFPMPVVIKPIASGSSVGVSIARDYKSLVETLISMFIQFDNLLIEEYISGKEATVGVIDKFRDQKIYAMLPVEIKIPQEKYFFDYEAKYSGKSEEICPGNFNNDEKEVLQRYSILAHDSLGLRHYSRTDFIIHPRRGIYALETNSLPGLTKESLFPKSLPPIGSNYKEFLDHVIELAMRDL